MRINIWKFANIVSKENRVGHQLFHDAFPSLMPYYFWLKRKKWTNLFILWGKPCCSQILHSISVSFLPNAFPMGCSIVWFSFYFKYYSVPDSSATNWAFNIPQNAFKKKKKKIKPGGCQFQLDFNLLAFNNAWI